MALGQLTIELLAKTASFETDTRRAEKRMRELGAEAKKVGAAIGTAFTAAAAATAYFVKSSIDAADSAIKSAQAIGLTVEAYTSLAFAADLSGTSQEQLGIGLTKLARQASDAAAGVKSALAPFDALGISVKNASGEIKDTDQLLGEIASKFAGYADGAEKTALATRLFGDAGAKLIPLLNQGAAGIDALKREAAELGLVMDTKTAKAAEQFNDDLTRLGSAVRGLGNDLTRAALPALQATATAMLDMRRSSVEAGNYIPTLGGYFNDLAVDIARSVAQIHMMNVELVGQARIIGVVGRGLWKAIDGSNTSNADIVRQSWQEFRAISDGVKADVERAQAQLKAFEQNVRIGPALTGERLNSFNDSRSTVFGQTAPALPPPPGLPSGGGSNGADAAEKYLDGLRKQLQGTHDLTTAEAALAEIQSGRLGKISAAQELMLTGLASEIDATKEAQRIAAERAAARTKEYDEINAFVRAQQEADAARLTALTAGASENMLKEAVTDIQFLNSAYERGAISVGVWADSVQAATEKLKEQGTELDSFTKNMAENIQGFLGDSLADALQGNFSDIEKSFKAMLNRMIAEAAAAELMRLIFGSSAPGGNSGSGNGLLGAVFNWAASSFGGSKASGGDVMPGREYWVGENGPEMFRPRTMGTIVPNVGGQAGGAAQPMVFNVNVQGDASENTVRLIRGAMAQFQARLMLEGR